jgi:hypothetical protein
MVNGIWRVVAALVVLQVVCLPTQVFCQWVEQVVDPAMAGDDKALVDVDGDGYLDIVVGGKRVEDEPLTWYHYPDWRKYVIAVAADEFTTEMDVGDMDGDGDMDLVVCDGQSGVNCRYYVNPRPGGDPRQQAAWTSRDIGSGGGWVHDVRVGDHNRDGRLDVLTNRGLFTRNGDGDLDLLSAEMFHEVAVFLNTGGGTFVKQLLSTAGSHNAVLGDVDKDDDLDVMGCNYTGNPPLRLWRNQGSVAPVTPVVPVSGTVISPMLLLLLSD